jgi:hypothetical protein
MWPGRLLPDDALHYWILQIFVTRDLLSDLPTKLARRVDALLGLFVHIRQLRIQLPRH